jgi:glycine/D-amino acid oxidase-like deaminating enzyme/nitrite reductase/ring-hydroxylating ferredoxin subunit
MPSDSGRTTSVWMATGLVPPCPPLTQDARADVCVVGAGIAGLTTAYLLAKEGKRVVVLDDNAPGGGETGRTTAHLSSALDDRFTFLERVHGERGARLAYESHDAAISKIEQIARDESIACDFERLDGYLFLAPGHEEDRLQKELEAAHRAGFSDVEFVPRAPLGGFDTGRCLRFPRQAQFHVLKYLAGLLRAIGRLGGAVHTAAHVLQIDGGPPARVATKAGPTVEADAVVVATNSPINDRYAIHTKQAPYRTYAVGLRVPMGTVFTGLYWDTLDAYHYVRLQRVNSADNTPDHDVLIVGGEDHKTGQGEVLGHFDALESWTRERFPMAEAVEFRWSGQVLEPFDGLAFLGRNPGGKDNVFIATGDSGHGMTHGTIAGMLISDLIAGRQNPWATLYDPSRKMHRALKGFLEENVNVALKYGDWITPGEVASVNDIQPGHGALIRKGLKKLAVYKDETGGVHALSATCPHLGCVVHWNDVEKSWDCPCHGSRFDSRGRVVNGPSPVNLKAAEL